MKIVYLFNEVTGIYEGSYEAQESPLEPGVYITPTASTDIAPPALAAGESLHWTGSAWQVIAAVVPVLPIAPTFASLKDAEFASFRTQREAFLNRLAGIGMAAQVNAQADVAANCVLVRQGLLDLTSAPAVVAATDIAGLKLAMKNTYNTVKASAIGAVLQAYAKVDA
jgi:hypothetical protein